MSEPYNHRQSSVTTTIHLPLSTAEQSFELKDSTICTRPMPAMENRYRASSTPEQEKSAITLDSSAPLLAPRQADQADSLEKSSPPAAPAEEPVASIASTTDITSNSDDPLLPVSNAPLNQTLARMPRHPDLPTECLPAEPPVLNHVVILIDACQSRDRNLIQGVLKSTPRHQLGLMNEAGETALGSASAAGLTDIVKLLVAAGADLNGMDKQEMTALHHAVKHGRHDTVKWLLRHKARLINSGSGTPLYLAFLGGDDRMIRRLLKATKNFSADEILMKAILSEHLAAVRAMLRHGLPVNPALDGMHSPLMRALSFGKLEAAQLLLVHGADPSAVSRGLVGEIESPLSVAVKNRLTGDMILTLLAMMKRTVVMVPEIAAQLFRRATDEQDYRILSELAEKTFVDANGKRYDPSTL